MRQLAQSAVIAAAAGLAFGWLTGDTVHSAVRYGLAIGAGVLIGLGLSRS